jgi:hypothetical protein
MSGSTIPRPRWGYNFKKSAQVDKLTQKIEELEKKLTSSKKPIFGTAVRTLEQLRAERNARLTSVPNSPIQGATTRDSTQEPDSLPIHSPGDIDIWVRSIRLKVQADYEQKEEI